MSGIRNGRQGIGPPFGSVLGSSLLSLPLIGQLGPSTTAQGEVAVSDQMRGQSIGPIQRALVRLNQRAKLYSWNIAGTREGFVWGADGNGMSALSLHVPEIINSDVKIIVVETGRNDIPNQSTAVYCTNAQALLQSFLDAPGIRHVIWPNIWLRGTGSGTPWGVGEFARQRSLDINAIMEPWCASHNVIVANLYNQLTDPADVVNHNPYAGVMRSDETHFAPRGADLASYTYEAIFTALMEPDVEVAGLNLAPALAGAAGVKGTGVVGNAPTGYTINITAAGVPLSTAAVTTVGGVVDIALNAAAVVDAAGEEIIFSVTGGVGSLVVGNWYILRADIETSTFDNWRGISAHVSDNAGSPHSAIGMMPVNSGGSGVTTIDSASLQEADLIDGVLQAGPLQFTGTGSSMSLRFKYFGSAIPANITIRRFEFLAVADPTPAIGPIITSATSGTLEGDNVQTFSLALTATKAVTWSIIGGADQALFSISGGTNLTLAAKDFSSPVDSGLNNTYIVQVMADDNNGARIDTKIVTVTVTDPIRWQSPGIAGGSIGATVDVVAGDITLVLPADIADGNLLEAAIAYRDVPNFATPAGWTASPTQQISANATSGATTSVASLAVFYCIYNSASPPSMLFTRTAGSVARGWTKSRAGGLNPTFDTSVGNTLGAGNVVASNAGLTTALPKEYLSTWVAWARNTNGSGCVATDPAGASGAGDATIDPAIGTWTERKDNSFATVPSVGLANFDAVKSTAGATGTISITGGLSARHATQTLAFKIGT